MPSRVAEMNKTYLRDALLVLSSEENGPCDATGVLALEEERFSLAVLKTEDLAITTNVKLALFSNHQHQFLKFEPYNLISLFQSPAPQFLMSPTKDSSPPIFASQEFGDSTFPG